MTPSQTVDLATLTTSLLGGLAIFLFGLGQMTDAMKSVAGGGLRAVLARLTRNRFAAAFTGALVTAVIQSSSVATVLVVGFVSAGIMTLAQSVGVIMGCPISARYWAVHVTKDSSLREHLVALLEGGHAHAGIEGAIKEFPIDAGQIVLMRRLLRAWGA